MNVRIPYEIIKIYRDKGIRLIQFVPMFFGEADGYWYDRFDYDSF